jgi:very-short-patch-repair endonuclease
MPVLRPVTPAERGKVDTERVAELAASQSGVVSRAQLESVGVSDSALSRWVHARRLHRVHPGVYAVGHSVLSLDGLLFAALLYGGDEAVFSHTTAAWLWRLIEADPKRIHLTVPGRRSSWPGVRVHHSRQIDRSECRGFPVTSVARTLLDIAGMLPFRQLRRALAEAEYRKILEPTEIRAVTGSGRRGSRALRLALDMHMPELAETLSVLEERFLELCEAAALPTPEVNRSAGLMRVDAFWRAESLAVEVDGGDAHAGLGQMKRDRDRELALRAKGFQVVRYTWEQVNRRPRDVAEDLRRLLGR